MYYINSFAFFIEKIGSFTNEIKQLKLQLFWFLDPYHANVTFR